MEQYIERGKLEKNVDVCFQKGKLQFDGNTVHILSDHDAFSIFQKIKGTPKFWLAARNELLAMIEALGPFNCFFTLSSAEKCWHEVTIAIFEKEGHKIMELCGLWKILINKIQGNYWNSLVLEEKGDNFVIQVKDGPTIELFEE